MADHVTIVVDPADQTCARPPVQWALAELRGSLQSRAVAVELGGRPQAQDPHGLRIVVSSAKTPAAGRMVSAAGVAAPEGPEAFALVPGGSPGKPEFLACAAGVRGLVYAILEMKDRVECSDDPASALHLSGPLVERPFNTVRSVMRLFASEVEDKPWFHDREFWRAYLSMLIAQRFNRFSLALGIGYDFPRHITDSYFYFAYPFFLEVPGYAVQVKGLSPAERDRNLETLRFVSEEAALRGLHFQLGLWTHSYELIDSPTANYTIDGLTPETHAAYCRDAVCLLLESCPAISGVTMRVHGESGIREGDYGFWRTVFEGVVRCGRPVELDMHSKGLDRTMIDTALGTGLPVTVSPKFWAEHMGLPYQQASVREMERVPEERGGHMAFSEGSRRFTRYGYADLLREDRRYGVLFRMWPGTQRLLLWGDPAMAAAFGRASAFCGCRGLELFEPLSFKGRKGSGLTGARQGYADASLLTAYDWQKYLYTYRLWGRLTYDPDADPQTWRRFLTRQYGAHAGSMEGALSNVSRILPLVTTAYHPSAANNSYWPEMHTNMPIVAETGPNPYWDTPEPRRLGTVSPLDPVLFAGVDEFAGGLTRGSLSGKVSPLEVADRLAELAEHGVTYLRPLQAEAGSGADPALRRAVVDAKIQVGLGRFFAGKLRAGVLYAIFQRTQSQTVLQQALESYRTARQAWVQLAGDAGVYADDLTFGATANLRGHWRDRLAAIDQDLAAMAAEAGRVGKAPEQEAEWDLNVAARRTPGPACDHVPDPSFERGRPLPVELSLAVDGSHERPTAMRLHYRHVNQAEAYVIADMQSSGERWRAAIPGAYSDSPYPLQYFFELRYAGGRADLYPGVDFENFGQPYFVVRQA